MGVCCNNELSKDKATKEVSITRDVSLLNELDHSKLIQNSKSHKNNFNFNNELISDSQNATNIINGADNQNVSKYKSTKQFHKSPILNKLIKKNQVKIKSKMSDEKKSGHSKNESNQSLEFYISEIERKDLIIQNLQSQLRKQSKQSRLRKTDNLTKSYNLSALNTPNKTSLIFYDKDYPQSASKIRNDHKKSISTNSEINFNNQNSTELFNLQQEIARLKDQNAILTSINEKNNLLISQYRQEIINLKSSFDNLSYSSLKLKKKTDFLSEKNDILKNENLLNQEIIEKIKELELKLYLSECNVKEKEKKISEFISKELAYKQNLIENKYQNHLLCNCINKVIRQFGFWFNSEFPKGNVPYDLDNIKNNQDIDVFLNNKIDVQFFINAVGNLQKRIVLGSIRGSLADQAENCYSSNSSQRMTKRNCLKKNY